MIKKNIKPEIYKRKEYIEENKNNSMEIIQEQNKENKEIYNIILDEIKIQNKTIRKKEKTKKK